MTYILPTTRKLHRDSGMQYTQTKKKKTHLNMQRIISFRELKVHKYKGENNCQILQDELCSNRNMIDFKYLRLENIYLRSSKPT